MAKPKLEEYEIEGVDALFPTLETDERTAQTIPIGSIVLPQKQPRRYFDREALSRLTNSIKEKGILQPLLVRPLESNTYELVAGERRYQAAQKADLKSVPVVIRDLTDADAYELALMENLQREDLNPVEETEGILELLSRKLDKEKTEIISIFQQTAHPNRTSKKQTVNTSIHKNDLEVIDSIFTSLGKLTINSFRTNRLPLLNLPSYLLEALQQGKIEYSKARVIGRVKDGKKAKLLLAEAIKDNLSRKEIEERVGLLNKKKNKTSRLQKRWDNTILKINKAKIWQKTEKKKRLEEILSELDELLND
ncbi:MAG: ParB/RepB/Spo0J family partition protein [Pleurocapsa sp. MO_192.B19]|nr:ParB/RepB/Spo0J family partition protein [Pleurocapsa sp. MO_192.B19]